MELQNVVIAQYEQRKVRNAGLRECLAKLDEIEIDEVGCNKGGEIKHDT